MSRLGLRAAFQEVVRATARRIAVGRTRDVRDAFHGLYYNAGLEGGTWKDMKFLGVPLLKYPSDLWIYQEILWEVRPTLIIECGTNQGGSALYLASLCDIINQGRIITIDITAPVSPPKHPRITYFTGSSVKPEVVAAVKREVTDDDVVLVILDSDHSERHVLDECRTYGPLVTRGSYLVVEDTNVNGHPVLADHGPGPHEAVEAYLSEAPAFRRDRSREKFLMTFNPGGYLRRLK